jgi:restriction system protein
MARRKTLLDDIFEFLYKVSVVYAVVLVLAFRFDRALFWKMLWWGIGFVVVLVLTAVIIKKFKTHKQSQWLTDRDLLYWLRGMKPWEFENYIADLFNKLGYKAYAVGGGYDRGVDVIAEKNGIKHYIQCKKYITSEVGVGELRDFYGAIADHLAEGKGYFITTNKFTLEAERFAADKPIELIDSFKLIKLIREVEKQNNQLEKQNNSQSNNN